MVRQRTGVTVEIDYDLCENAQTCELVCPTGVFALENGRVVVAQPGECTLCFKCVELCPAAAISIDY